MLVFEATFSFKEGALHTLKNSYFYEGKEVLFSTWSADFLTEDEDSFREVQYPIWAHFLGLPTYLRNTAWLMLLGKRLGKILSIDLSDCYVGKT